MASLVSTLKRPNVKKAKGKTPNAKKCIEIIKFKVATSAFNVLCIPTHHLRSLRALFVEWLLDTVVIQAKPTQHDLREDTLPPSSTDFLDFWQKSK